MKNRIVSAVVFIILGLLTALGPKLIFPVCDGNEKMLCHQSAAYLLYIGLGITAAGILTFFLKGFWERVTLSVAAAAGGAFTYLIPALFVGLCKMPVMRCRTLTFPSLGVISIITVLYGILNAVYLIIKKYNNTKRVNV